MTSSAFADRFLSRRAQEVSAIQGPQTSLPMKGAINLTVGPPEFSTPAHIIEAAKRALDQGYTKTTPWPGFPDLREAIAEKLARDNGLQYDPAREILVTAGSQEALFVTHMALLDPGDEIIMPSPYYPAYERDAIIAGGKLVKVPTLEENCFEVDPLEIEKCITPRTKAVLLLTPGNPTGTVISHRTLLKIADLVKEHDLMVIADELYERWVWDDHKHHSMGTFPGMWERTLTVQGFSKSYSMTGFRVGYVAGPADFIQRMIGLKHSATISTPAMSQRAALAALKGPMDWWPEIFEIYAERRRLWLEALEEMGLSHGGSQGSFYIFVNITSTGMTSQEFVDALFEEAKVLVGSGVGYGGEGYVRVSFQTPTEQLKAGLQRMTETVLRWRRG